LVNGNGNVKVNVKVNSEKRSDGESEVGGRVGLAGLRFRRARVTVNVNIKGAATGRARWAVASGSPDCGFAGGGRPRTATVFQAPV
jgi:hypothetical protein